MALAWAPIQCLTGWSASTAMLSMRFEPSLLAEIDLEGVQRVKLPCEDIFTYRIPMPYLVL